MLVRKQDDQALYDLIQEKNLLRQYDYLLNCIEIGISQGPNAFDKYFLWALNHIAVANISQFGGRFRDEPIYVGNHTPPHYNDVPELMDRFVTFIQENWFVLTPTMLASYGLWRLNWIHPFIEGNGRTARAVCYYLLCVRSGALWVAKRLCRSGLGRIESLTSRPFGLPTKPGIRAITTSAQWKHISHV
jgi:Fic family protein